MLRSKPLHRIRANARERLATILESGKRSHADLPIMAVQMRLWCRKARRKEVLEWNRRPGDVVVATVAIQWENCTVKQYSNLHIRHEEPAFLCDGNSTNMRTGQYQHRLVVANSNSSLYSEWNMRLHLGYRDNRDENSEVGYMSESFTSKLVCRANLHEPSHVRRIIFAQDQVVGQQRGAEKVV